MCPLESVGKEFGPPTPLNLTLEVHMSGVVREQGNRVAFSFYLGLMAMHISSRGPRLTPGRTKGYKFTPEA